jgi:hypothetical protein
MDGAMSLAHGRRRQPLVAGAVALSIALLAARPTAVGMDDVPDVPVKVAFVINFAKFTEWPVMAAGIPIVLCVAGDDGMATAMVQAVQGQHLSGHSFAAVRSQDTREWRVCHVLFISDSEIRHVASGLSEIRALPVLTVSDAKGFAERGGMIELYVEAGRMRFRINQAAAERSGLRLSSRLLGLATVIQKDEEKEVVQASSTSILVPRSYRAGDSAGGSRGGRAWEECDRIPGLRQ